MTLFRMTLSGSVLILIVSAFRLLFRDRVHRSIFPALWTLISLRMLVPYFLPITFSAKETVPELLQKASTIRTTAVHTVSEAADKTPPLSRVLLMIWLLGAVFFLLFFIGSHLRNCIRYRFSVPIPNCGGELGGMRVRMLDGLAGPLTYGILRPTVLLPATFDWSNTTALHHILTHESIHIRCLDLLRKAIMLLVIAVHWFNPLAWLLFKLASQDMEIRCDALTVRLLGKASQKEYARTLVDMEQHRFDLLQAGFSFNRTLTRLKALSKEKVSTGFSIGIAAVLSGVFVLCCLSPSFSAVALPPQNEDFPVASVSEETVSQIEPVIAESVSAPAEEPVEPTPNDSDSPSETDAVYSYEEIVPTSDAPAPNEPEHPTEPEQSLDDSVPDVNIQMPYQLPASPEPEYYWP